jgi:fused signal recognition particle receptor
VIKSKNDSSPEQTLLVVDGANGTNALSQAREFHKFLNLTGVIVTKLDSSAKGGVVAALKAEQNLDTLWIGSGEAVEDLAPFDPSSYAERFFGKGE